MLMHNSLRRYMQCCSLSSSKHLTSPSLQSKHLCLHQTWSDNNINNDNNNNYNNDNDNDDDNNNDDDDGSLQKPQWTAKTLSAKAIDGLHRADIQGREQQHLKAFSRVLDDRARDGLC